MKNQKVSKKKGFSLVELLVVIAVIGVIAAIAIPAMSSIFGESETARNRRNAQNIASVANAAVAAGATVDTSTVAALITDLSGDGVTVPNNGSVFANKRFSIGALDPDAATDCAPHLSVANGVVTYSATPITP